MNIVNQKWLQLSDLKWLKETDLNYDVQTSEKSFIELQVSNILHIKLNL
jgi:hypothetical protein